MTIAGRVRDAARQATPLLTRILDLALPPRCPSCLVAIARQGGLCAPCWAGLALVARPFCERLGVPFAYDHGEGMLSPDAIANPPAYGKARVATLYQGVAVELVHRLKYGDRVDLAPLMGRLMARAGGDVLAGADLLVPVPLHRGRLWRRRFNQSALLCDAIFRESGIARDPLLIRRRRRTRQQVGLSRVERARNVQGAFTVPEDRLPSLAGRRIVVVDDVITTGATVEAVARTLLRAGAASVDVLAFARVAAVLDGGG